jgi:hypothetical protein
MAVGDVVAAKNATAGSGTFTIQPGSGAEWVIHNIYVSGKCDVKVTDGTTSVTIESPAGAQWLSNLQVHLTNGEYLQITDTSGSTNDMGYDGVVSK